MSTHDEIVAQMEIYVTENNKFVEKGIKSSATRARKATAAPPPAPLWLW